MSPNSYVIETIPLEEEVEVETPSRWVPFKPHQAKCGNGKCYPVVGRCLKCGDVFPCPSGNCGHFDCADPEAFGIDCKGNGTEVPDNVCFTSTTVQNLELHVLPQEDKSPED